MRFDVFDWPAVNYIIFLYKEPHERELPAWLMHLSFTWPAWGMATLDLFKCFRLGSGTVHSSWSYKDLLPGVLFCSI